MLTAERVGTTEITLAVISDPEGGYSAIALNLPGAGSCGETVDEAVENAREAIRAVLEAYIEAEEEIPWREPAQLDVPNSATLLRITLNV
jgi:predicted RNase H-like HicB family nuclease